MEAPQCKGMACMMTCAKNLGCLSNTLDTMCLYFTNKHKCGYSCMNQGSGEKTLFGQHRAYPEKYYGSDDLAPRGAASVSLAALALAAVASGAVTL